MQRGRDERQLGGTFWERMGACLCLLSCITCELLVCICFTLPTVWHPLTTSWSATLPIFWAAFLFPSRLSEPPPPPPPSPPPSRLQLVIFLSLAYSLTLAFSHMLSYRLAHFSYSPSSLALSSRSLTLALRPPPPPFLLTLCSCSLREMEVCKLFSPWWMPGLLSVHLNELISPFFS